MRILYIVSSCIEFIVQRTDGPTVVHVLWRTSRFFKNAIRKKTQTNCFDETVDFYVSKIQI